jgi:hypothetical protein
MEAIMIYSRYGGTILITDARIIPVWSVRSPGRISRLYERPPAKVRKSGKWVDCKPDELPVWHYKGTYDDGSIICDGKWMDASVLTADEGWTEISQVLEALSPESVKKYKEWNQSALPIELFFPPVDEKEIA